MPRRAAAMATIDPITGERLRTSRRGENRYEHCSPDRLIQVDVKKRGRIPALVRRPRHPSVILFERSDSRMCGLADTMVLIGGDEREDCAGHT